MEGSGGRDREGVEGGEGEEEGGRELVVPWRRGRGGVMGALRRLISLSTAGKAAGWIGWSGWVEDVVTIPDADGRGGWS